MSFHRVSSTLLIRSAAGRLHDQFADIKLPFCRSLVTNSSFVKFNQFFAGSPWRFISWHSVPSSQFADATLYNIKRHFATKGKDREKAKQCGDRPKVVLHDDEMECVLYFEEFKDAVDSLVDELKADLQLNYNLRLNPRQIECLQLSFEGATVTLADIVTIARKPSELVINLSSMPSAVKPTLKALHESGLSLTPQQDGNVIYIRLAKATTTDHRLALIKSAKTAGQKTKDKLKDRNFQKRFYIKDSKKLSQDLLADVAANLKFYVMQKCQEIDDIVKQKSDSLMN